MAKKHRVKNQRQVEHIRQQERERDAYLAKRQNRKRGRKQAEDEMPPFEEGAPEVPPVDEEGTKRKKQRLESDKPSTKAVAPAPISAPSAAPWTLNTVPAVPVATLSEAKEAADDVGVTGSSSNVPAKSKRRVKRY